MSTKSQAPANIGTVGMLRWAWRQLTTMRFALILLLVLAMAAVPGSLLPQRIQDPGKVRTFIEDNGTLGEGLDKLQMFDVYSSIWFSAVYILLMVSLVGCIVPRCGQHYKAMRKAPPKAPRRLARMPAHQEWELAGTDSEELLDRAQRALKKAGYRTVRNDDHVAAERGYLRETGNLLFHFSILWVVVVFALGALVSYSGQRILVEGETFSNSLVSYDDFKPGTYYNPDNLDDFRITLNRFDATFDSESVGPQFAQPRHFAANVTTNYQGVEENKVLQVNDPVRFGRTSVYLTGNGYAPEVTVKNANGDVTFSGPVVFLPVDGTYASRGVVKVPDTGGEQLGFGGVFLPTAGLNEQGELISTFPAADQPYLVMSVYAGDLGLDDGVAQNVYELDTSKMRAVTDNEGKPVTLQMAPGETVELPEGLGTVTFDGVKRFVAVDIHSNPTQGVLLVGAVLLMVGLGLSLFIPRRRVWVRVTDGRVEVAALARGEDPRVQHAVKALTVHLNESAREEED